MLTTTGNKIDLNQDLTIYNCDSQDIVKSIDLQEAILEIFPNEIIPKK